MKLKEPATKMVALVAEELKIILFNGLAKVFWFRGQSTNVLINWLLLFQTCIYNFKYCYFILVSMSTSCADDAFIASMFFLMYKCRVCWLGIIVTALMKWFELQWTIRIYHNLAARNFHYFKRLWTHCPWHGSMWWTCYRLGWILTWQLSLHVRIQLFAYYFSFNSH